MEFKVRVKTNDNDNVEEWVPVEMLLSPLVSPLATCVRAFGDLLADEWRTQLNTILSPFEKIELLNARVERLEQIIVNMSTGTVCSGPDVGPYHTHWSYPVNGARDLVRDMMEGHWPEADAALDEYLEEDEERCPRCGERYWRQHGTQDLCTDCESELAEEQATRNEPTNDVCPF